MNPTEVGALVRSVAVHYGVPLAAVAVAEIADGWSIVVRTATGETFSFAMPPVARRRCVSPSRSTWKPQAERRRDGEVSARQLRVLIALIADACRDHSRERTSPAAPRPRSGPRTAAAQPSVPGCRRKTARRPGRRSVAITR